MGCSVCGSGFVGNCEAREGQQCPYKIVPVATKAEIIRFLWQLRRRLEIELRAIHDPDDKRDAAKNLQDLNNLISEVEK